MKLKLLHRKDTLLESKEMGIQIRLGRLMPEHIGEMSGLRQASNNPAISIAIYALRECISELTIAGEEYQARQLSFQINPQDADTAAALMVIAALVLEEVMMDDAMRKKLQQQRKTSLQENTPSDAANAVSPSAA